MLYLAAAAERKKEAIPYDERPLEENVNRLIPEGDSARSVEDAISVLRYKVVYNKLPKVLRII